MADIQKGAIQTQSEDVDVPDEGRCAHDVIGNTSPQAFVYLFWGCLGVYQRSADRDFFLLYLFLWSTQGGGGGIY